MVGHVEFYGLTHGRVEGHDVVVWHYGELVCCPGFEGVGVWVVVAAPVGGFEVEVAAEEGVKGWTGWIGHFVGGGAGAVVPFVVFSGDWEGGEGGVDVGVVG